MPILELLRILFSKEARNSASGVMKFIRRQPEWKQDVVTLSGKFTDGRKEQALAFTGHAESLLTAKNWESDAARQVRFASMELITNGFEHGLGEKKKGSVRVQLELSSEYCRIEVTDPGEGFDLEFELQRQEADNSRSTKVRALSLIHRMSSELSQEKSRSGNKIRAILKAGHRPCEIYDVGKVKVFGFQGETQPSGYFWAGIVRQVEELSPDRRIVLDFTNVKDYASRFIAEVVMLMKEYGWIQELKSESGPGPAQFLDLLAPGSQQGDEEAKVVVSGVDDDLLLAEFLGTRFKTFKTLDEALQSFGVSKEPRQ